MVTHPKTDVGQTELDDAMGALVVEIGQRAIVYNKEASKSFVHHPEQALSPQNTDPIDYQILFSTTINRLLSGEIQNATLPVDAIRHLTRSEITDLEIEGINLSGISEQHPDGGIFLKDFAISRLPGARMPESMPTEGQNEITAIAATSFLRGVTKVTTHRPIDKIPEKLNGLPRLPMHSLVAAVHKEGKWSESHVLPDGEYVRGGFDDNGTQYAQSAFEGLVASDESDPVEIEMQNGKVTIFRPEKNARRFQMSCRAMKMPIISVNQFIASIQAAVENNKQFIPKNGKLYIRPFMVGLKGGTGIHQAKSYLFAVEVSPYGQYLKAASEGIDLENELPGGSLKAEVFERPANGKFKSGANYGTLLRIKEEAIAKGFNDILLITKNKKIQECSSNNFFLVENESDTHFIIHTSSLQSNILPGITRESLIALLRDPKIKKRFGADMNITVLDGEILDENMISHCQGAFGTGTAAGISNFRNVETTTGKKIEYKDQPTQRFIKKLYDLLQDVRRGKVPGYENWAMTVIDKQKAA